MSTTRVQAFLDENAPDVPMIHTDADTSTVSAAAGALNVDPAQIAKTLAVRAGDTTVLLVTSGNTRLDNAKFRVRFGAKPRMLSALDTETLTGQPVGGVGPFGHPQPLSVFCDQSLQAFDDVYPAGGSLNSAIRLTPTRLADLADATWVDVTRPLAASALETPTAAATAIGATAGSEPTREEKPA